MWQSQGPEWVLYLWGRPRRTKLTNTANSITAKLYGETYSKTSIAQKKKFTFSNNCWIDCGSFMSTETHKTTSAITWICNKMGRMTWLAVCQSLLLHSTWPTGLKFSCNEIKLILNVIMIGPTSVKLKTEWNYTSVLQCIFMAYTGTLPFTFGHDDRKCPCYVPLLVNRGVGRSPLGAAPGSSLFMPITSLFISTKFLPGTDDSGLCLGRDQFSPILIDAEWTTPFLSFLLDLSWAMVSVWKFGMSDMAWCKTGPCEPNE